MPLLIGVVLIGIVSGLLASRRVALAITGVASALVLIAWVRAVTDGKGNDPAWGIILAAGVCAIALGLATVLANFRQSRRLARSQGA